MIIQTIEILKNEIEKNYSNIVDYSHKEADGTAINIATKLVTTKYFLINNKDIEGINEKNIFKFLDAAKKLNDKFSSLGPRFMNADPKSHIQSDDRLNIAEMKFISGSCMFFQKEKFEKLGGFDENFFLYFEESDFCFRANKINKNYQINDIEINHNVKDWNEKLDDKEKKELEKLKKLGILFGQNIFIIKKIMEKYLVFFFYTYINKNNI